MLRWLATVSIFVIVPHRRGLFPDVHQLRLLRLLRHLHLPTKGEQTVLMFVSDLAHRLRGFRFRQRVFHPLRLPTRAPMFRAIKQLVHVQTKCV